MRGKETNGAYVKELKQNTHTTLQGIRRRKGGQKIHLFALFS